MRKGLALLLIGLLTSGCYTTTRTAAVAASPPPPSRPETRVAGVVLRDGTAVRFAEPVSASADGSVTGNVEVPWPYPGASREGTAMQRTTYAAADIVSYQLETEHRRLHLGKSALAVLGVAAAAALAFAIAFYIVTSDPNY